MCSNGSCTSLRYPGQKVGTSIAIRGGYGDGKTIVLENLMSRILGDLLLLVTNHRMILGDFNEAMLGKLLIVCEEAAFAGDKAAFDRMKDLITGEKMLINPKFKAPITVDNYARLVVISNHAALPAHQTGRPPVYSFWSRVRFGRGPASSNSLSSSGQTVGRLGLCMTP